MKKILMTREGSVFYADITKDYHTQYGFVSKNDMKKDKAKTSKGKEVAVIKPSFIDIYKRIKRHAQIITFKDVGLIITMTGINKTSFVVDMGSGSGALSCFIASIAKKVVTYDIDDRSITAVQENIKSLGLKNITLKKKDCYEGIDEKNADVITMDLPEPWRALEHARNALKPGGFLVNYSPHVTQAQRVVNEASGFVVLKTVELIEREWIVDGKRARPDFRGLGHTGFLTFMRRFE
ncbi:MAG: methyltransferase domain-containing protein [Nanoarchaeota archaeon]|nr:methyltransferase domain-containing protein [Nanoarchaeota archaeon]